MTEREILFRGKRVDNGKWVEGGYIPLDVDSGYTYIIESCNYASTFSALDLIKLHSILVIPSTVGQFTGLTDKNGRKIFEGDIVRRFNGRGQEVMRYAVKWNTDCCMFVLMCEDTYFGEYSSDFTVFYGEDLEVVGNIYDGGFEFD